MYAYSFDEENYVGEFETPDAAAAEAFSDDNESDSVWVGEINKQTAHGFVSGAVVLDDIAERAYEECGEHSDDWLRGVMRDKAKVAELENLIGDWIQAHEPPTFWTVNNVKLVKRT